MGPAILFSSLEASERFYISFPWSKKVAVAFYQTDFFETNCGSRYPHFPTAGSSCENHTKSMDSLCNLLCNLHRARHRILEDFGGFWRKTDGFEWPTRARGTQTAPERLEIIPKALGVDY